MVRFRKYETILKLRFFFLTTWGDLKQYCNFTELLGKCFSTFNQSMCTITFSYYSSFSPHKVKFLRYKKGLLYLIFSTFYLMFQDSTINCSSGDGGGGILIKMHSRDFPHGPGAKTLSSQCRRPGFNPCSGN